jgi:hypothetical protein
VKHRDDWPRPKSEAELCERFAAHATPSGLTVYPETGGFDQLLVAADGTQVGVEAKLRGTFEVLLQAHPGVWFDDATEERVGPDYRAVLVPEAPARFAGVALAMGLHCYELRQLEAPHRGSPRIAVPSERLWPHLHRITLPSFVPTMPAGVPSPKRMTRWLTGAIALCAHLRAVGFVTIYDFRRHGLHPQIWLDRWVEWRGETTTTIGRRRTVRVYRRREGVALPDAGTGAPGSEPVAEPGAQP